MSTVVAESLDLNSPQARHQYETWVRDLAALGHRGAGTANEWTAAQYLLGQLGKLGIDGRLERFDSHGTLAARCALHVLIAGIAGYYLEDYPLVSVIIAAVVLVSMYLEFATRGVWLSRLLPRRASFNVVADIAAREPTKRILLAAHYDTQQTALIWFLFQYLSPLFWILPTWLKPPFLAIGVTMFAHIALVFGFWLDWDITEPWYWMIGFYIGFFIILAEWAIHSHVPGASDNASGVAAILTYVANWHQNPRDDVQLAILFPSCEEAGLAGSMAWADAHAAENAALPTQFLIMDNLGMGPPRYLGWEVPMVGWPVRYPKELKELAQAAAEEMDLTEPGPWAVPAPGDALSFLKRGLPGMSILSFHRWGYMPYYHLKGDTAEHHDFAAAWLGVRYGWRLLMRMVEAEPKR